MMNIECTNPLSYYISRVNYDILPLNIINVMKRCLLDTLGCAIAGSQRPEILHLIDGLTQPNEKGSAVVWGKGNKVPILTALMLNGSMTHAVELDDLHKPSKIHAGTVIVPPVLTVGSIEHISGKQLLCAMAVGYETTIRIAMGIGVDSHRRRGWHGTATCGSFGAAAAIGKILGLDEIQMANALGLAGTSTGGLMAYTADGSMSKRYHAGNAAVNGWMAAVSAKAGFTGPIYVLEAPDGGYAHAVSDRYDLSIITDGLGEVWHSLEMGHKYYACCGHIHQAIDCAVKLRNEYHIMPDDINSVEVSTYDVAGMSWGFTEPPKNTVEAQFSFPYAVSVALIDGAAFLPQFSEERLSDTTVNTLARKITVSTDEKYTKRYPKEWCSGVTITLNDGRKVGAETCGAKGDLVNPLSQEELEHKFISLTKSSMAPEKQHEIIELVNDIENLSDVDKLTRCLNYY